MIQLALEHIVFQFNFQLILIGFDDCIIFPYPTIIPAVVRDVHSTKSKKEGVQLRSVNGQGVPHHITGCSFN